MTISSLPSNYSYNEGQESQNKFKPKKVLPIKSPNHSLNKKTYYQREGFSLLPLIYLDQLLSNHITNLHNINKIT